MRTPKLCSRCGLDTLGRPFKAAAADEKPRRLCPNCLLRVASDAIREYKPMAWHPEAAAKRVGRTTKVANVLPLKRAARGGE